MSTRFFLVIFFSFFTITASAARRVVVANLSLSEKQFLQNWIVPDSTVITPENALREISQHVDARKVTHSRLQQEYFGFAVYGGHVILHEVGRQMLRTEKMSGAIYRDLTSDLGVPPPDLIARAPQILNTYKLTRQLDHVMDEDIKPIVYVDPQHKLGLSHQRVIE